MRLSAALLCAALCAFGASASAQQEETGGSRGDSAADAGNELRDGAGTARFKSKGDSLQAMAVQAAANRAKGMRIVVSLEDKRLWTILGKDTLLSAPIAVAKGTTLAFNGRSWTFRTPRGRRTVLRKEADPIWVPPDWLYAETALEHGLKMAPLYADRPVQLSNGRKLVVRDSVVGILYPSGSFAALPTDEHVIFGGTLYMPPIGTKNRRVEGELGKYRLDLGEGYLLHGTPWQNSIGTASTHGCVRLRDEDIEWLYDFVPVGTPVYIY